MGKLTLKYETTVEEDGRDHSVTFTEKGVETMEDCLLFLDQGLVLLLLVLQEVGDLQEDLQFLVRG